MKKIRVFLIAAVMLAVLCACGGIAAEPDGDLSAESSQEDTETIGEKEMKHDTENLSENFVLVTGGTFQMGSPEDEAWRLADEVRHTVTVSDFYMSVYELTQAEYQEVIGENPSSLSGEDLPVENISWLDAVRYCNARSEKEGLTPVYTIDGQNTAWDRSADGYGHER